MIIETEKWMKTNTIALEFSGLASINRILLLVLSIIVLLITPITLLAAKKATKDIGWDVYKKIGCSTEIQSKYTHTHKSYYTLAHRKN